MTEHNTFLQEIQEDLDRQKLEKLWKRYGAWVIVAAVTVIIGTAGYTAWSSWRTEMQQRQTDGLIEILSEEKTDPQARITALEGFAQKNPGAAQTTFAQLHAASLLVQAGDDKKAIEVYEAIAADPKADGAFRQFAELLSIRMQMDEGDPVTLQKRLQPLRANSAPFRQSAMETEAFLALRAGDKAKAAQIFTELTQEKEIHPSLAERATDMARFLNE